jgi:hypothetical protein
MMKYEHIDEQLHQSIGDHCLVVPKPLWTCECSNVDVVVVAKRKKYLQQRWATAQNGRTLEALSK